MIDSTNIKYTTMKISRKSLEKCEDDIFMVECVDLSIKEITRLHSNPNASLTANETMNLQHMIRAILVYFGRLEEYDELDEETLMSFVMILRYMANMLDAYRPEIRAEIVFLNDGFMLHKVNHLSSRDVNYRRNDSNNPIDEEKFTI